MHDCVMYIAAYMLKSERSTGELLKLGKVQVISELGEELGEIQVLDEDTMLSITS